MTVNILFFLLNAAFAIAILDLMSRVNLASFVNMLANIFLKILHSPVVLADLHTCTLLHPFLSIDLSPAWSLSLSTSHQNFVKTLSLYSLPTNYFLPSPLLLHFKPIFPYDPSNDRKGQPQITKPFYKQNFPTSAYVFIFAPSISLSKTFSKPD